MVPRHEQNKIQLIPSDLIFDGSAILPQFEAKKIQFLKQE